MEMNHYCAKNVRIKSWKSVHRLDDFSEKFCPLLVLLLNLLLCELFITFKSSTEQPSQNTLKSESESDKIIKLETLPLLCSI